MPHMNLSTTQTLSARTYINIILITSTNDEKNIFLSTAAEA